LAQDRVARYVEFIGRGDAALEELVQRMCDGEHLPEICRQKDLPYGRVLGWLMEDEGRYRAYQRGLEISAHALVSEALAIADEQKEAVRKDGGTYDPDVARDKLRVETRLKVAGKHAPKMYGERADVNVNHAVKVEIVAFTEEDVRRVAQERRGRVVEGEAAPSVGTAA